MQSTEVRSDTRPELRFELDEVPMDIFDLTEQGLTVESLTAGHGLGEFGASSVFSCSSSS
ncbi:thiomuracin/GE37468 family thiazolyl RiPP peptide [Dactylosporangium sp. NPDC049742]|uniref:thiomuracin/GE37468 family thiazolyl RiPP peptide n=1 Tax=Dactylosporangium sp. NPDC049742 TaxID=3154737 RepID=UPI00341941D7